MQKSLKDYRDECFDLYLKSLVEEKNLQLYADYTDGRGSSVDYKADGFELRLINDAGLMATELSLPEKDDFVETEILAEEKTGKNARLSLEDQVKFIKEHWAEIPTLLKQL